MKHKLQVRIYSNHEHVDYTHQLFIDVPILRWDNKEEFGHFATYPQHHHDGRRLATPSPLGGDPIREIVVVLQEVSDFLERKFDEAG